MWPYADGESYLRRRQAPLFLAFIASKLDAEYGWAGKACRRTEQP